MIMSNVGVRVQCKSYYLNVRVVTYLNARVVSYFNVRDVCYLLQYALFKENERNESR